MLSVITVECCILWHSGDAIAAGLLSWWLAACLPSSGSTTPLLNPLDITLVIALTATAYWLRDAKGLSRILDEQQTNLRKLFFFIVFISANTVLLRAVHHLDAIPWSLRTLLSNDAAQASLSLFRALPGLILMRLGWRSAVINTRSGLPGRP